MHKLFYTGIVESRNDPLKLGRCQVRVFGVHTANKIDIPTEHLPWAIPLMPITGASISGIGNSPTGPVEGSLVMVFFQDGESKQMPIMVGTVPAIPASKFSILTSEEQDTVIKFADELDPEVLTDSEGNVVTDSSGQPIKSGQPAPDDVQRTVKEAVIPPEIPIEGWYLGKTSEKFESGGRGPGVISSGAGDLGGVSYGVYQLASYISGGKMRNNKAINSPVLQYLSQSRFKQLFEKKDENGITFLMPASEEFNAKWKSTAAKYEKEFKDDQHDFIQRKYYDVAISILEKNSFDYKKYGPAVQDMIWSTAVQFGPGSVKEIFFEALKNKGSGLSEIEVVTMVMDYKIETVPIRFKSSSQNVRDGVRKRFLQEKKDLLALTSEYKDFASKETDASPDEKINHQKPSTFSFKEANGLTVATNKVSELKVLGFNDPNSVYPRYINEQDTSRLARSQNIQKTVVMKKEQNRVKTVDIANGNGLWEEPLSPYAASYPFNHVMETESGHVLEFDDTPKAERIHTYHKSGTYNEIDKNGTQVSRIVGDMYEIVDRNGYIYISGRCNVTIGGEANILVTGDLNMQVDGDTILNANNDLEINVAGDLSLGANGSIDIKSGKDITLTAEAGKISTKSKDAVIKAEVTAIVDSGSLSALTSDGIVELGDISKYEGEKGEGFGDAKKSEVRLITSRAVSEPNEFETLVTSKRQDDSAFSFETESEQSQSDSILETLGILDQAALTRKPIVIDTDVPGGQTDLPPIKQAETVEVPVDEISKLTEFPNSLRLSPNFTLGSVSSQARASIGNTVRDQYGLTQKEIVANLAAVCLNILEPIKQAYPDMVVNSGLRNHNTLKDSISKHCFGVAVDIQFTSIPNSKYYDIANSLKNSIKYDKMLLEFRDNPKSNSKTVWLHIEFDRRLPNKAQLVSTLNNDRSFPEGRGKLVNLA